LGIAQVYFRGNDLYQLDRYGKIGHAYPVLWELSTWGGKLGYQHETVNHSQGEYARGEVHVNTAEGLWNLLQEHLRKHHGVSKIYLPLYVARPVLRTYRTQCFEFLHNRRGQTDWSKLMDLLWLGVQADCRSLHRAVPAGTVRQVIREGNVKDLCLVPGVEVS